MPVIGRLRYLEAAADRIRTPARHAAPDSRVSAERAHVGAAAGACGERLARDRSTAPRYGRRQHGSARPRRWTSTPATSSTCSTPCTSRTRSSAACRWAATSRSRCSGMRRATFRGLVLADTRPQADTPEGVEGRAQDAGPGAEKGPAAVADEMMPEAPRRAHAARRGLTSPRSRPRADPGQLGRRDRGRDHRADDPSRFDAAARDPFTCRR